MQLGTSAVIVVVALASCDRDEAPALVDAQVEPDASQPCGDSCNLVAQTGCAASEKCTWQDVTATTAVTSCVPRGSVELGGACTVLPPGATGGYDDCGGGLYCLEGTCQLICTINPNSCPAPGVCTDYPGIFECDPTTGLCAGP